MYIAKIRMINFRCFKDTAIDFQPGLNVIIGENNAGKTTLLKALGLVFSRRGRSRPTGHDFYRLIKPSQTPPTISVEITVRSSTADTAADRALVASWLTKLDAPWEAQLTYSFFLPEQHSEDFKKATGNSPSRVQFYEAIDEFLPKFVSRIYGGNPATLVTADSESLSKFDCQFLDALRDVESEMFSGNTPLFRAMLEEVLDLDKEITEKRAIRNDFRSRSNSLRDDLVKRFDTERLFELVHQTGAGDGGTPSLEGGVDETDLIAALRLFVERKHFSFPATHQGLGYNNLLYISLLLASLAFRASEDRLGENAAIFPMLLIEEPEAHLHPALQYKLLTHIVSRVESEPCHNRQIFVTTHSTHITSAARLAPIICLSANEDSEVSVAYPAKLFPETTEGLESKCYVERFLDATKSTMLFAKAVVLVEGIAEQLVVPAIAHALGRAFDQHHVAIVRVDGLTFKHFLPLFGAGVDDKWKPFALMKRVACLVDADPAHRKRDDPSKPDEKHKWISCFPYQLHTNTGHYEYRPISTTVTSLRKLALNQNNIQIFNGIKTLEYDFAHANYSAAAFVTNALSHKEHLKRMAADPAVIGDVLKKILDADETNALDSISDEADRKGHRFASYYLHCAENNKGEHAFALESVLRELKRVDFACPQYVQSAIEWVTGGRLKDEPAKESL